MESYLTQLVEADIWKYQLLVLSEERVIQMICNEKYKILYLYSIK